MFRELISILFFTKLNFTLGTVLLFLCPKFFSFIEWLFPFVLVCRPKKQIEYLICILYIDLYRYICCVVLQNAHRLVLYNVHVIVLPYHVQEICHTLQYSTEYMYLEFDVFSEKITWCYLPHPSLERETSCNC